MGFESFGQGVERAACVDETLCSNTRKGAESMGIYWVESEIPQNWEVFLLLHLGSCLCSITAAFDALNIMDIHIYLILYRLIMYCRHYTSRNPGMSLW